MKGEIMENPKALKAFTPKQWAVVSGLFHAVGTALLLVALNPIFTWMLPLIDSALLPEVHADRRLIDHFLWIVAATSVVAGCATGRMLGMCVAATVFALVLQSAIMLPLLTVREFPLRAEETWAWVALGALVAGLAVFSVAAMLRPLVHKAQWSLTAALVAVLCMGALISVTHTIIARAHSVLTVILLDTKPRIAEGIAASLLAALIGYLDAKRRISRGEWVLP